MSQIQFQPFETLFDSQKTGALAPARGVWPRGFEPVPVALAHAQNLLFFQPLGAGCEWNFLVTSQGNPFFHPPARAFEKLGETRTLELFFKRAIASGAFGRLFVWREENGVFLVVLNSNGRHLLTDWPSPTRGRNLTPFWWHEVNLDLERQPSSLLWERVQNAFSDADSPPSRAKWWHGLDYFERLWQSLEFQNGNAQTLRETVRDLIQIESEAWNGAREGVSEWTFSLAIQAKEPHLQLPPTLFQKRGDLSWQIGEKLRREIEAVFEWHAPRRTRASDWEDLARREWLDHSGGTSSWNLEITIPRVSFHEQIEASLRLETWRNR